MQEALDDLRKVLTCNAFSISGSKWMGDARAKIIEIQAKLSATVNFQAQTLDAGAEDTVVK